MTETKELLRVPIEDVKNIGQLRDNIKELKQELNGLDIGSEKYNNTLKELQVNQAALKNAMHATTVEGDEQVTTMEDIAKAAKGAGTSYNALVKRMADLTQEYRATEDVVRRAQLGKEIKDINEELKRLDAARGIYTRNVGDYFNQIVPGLKNINDGLHLIGKQPVLGLLTLITPLVVKLVGALKENETALGAIDKLLAALKPVADFFAGILEKIAGWLGAAVEWVIKLGQNANISFNSIVAGAVGVGNAIYQFIATPIRNVIDLGKGVGEVFKRIFKGDFKGAADAAKDAGKNLVDNFKEGFSFKTNFETGKERGLTFAAGLKAPAVKAAASSAGKEVGQSFLEALENEPIQEAEMPDFIFDPDGELRAENQKLFEDLIAQRDAYDAEQARRDEWERQARQDALDQQKALDAERLKSYQQYASAVSGIFDALADIYESNGEADEQATRKAKALRTASAVISTISGAVSAYMNTIESVKIPAVAIPLAALNAASVLAAGYAQIKQINAVKVGSSTGGGAAASAPAFSPSVTQVRTITGQSEEERLNRMASDTRVYLVYSDVERAQESQRVRVQETEF